ncbi:TrkH family potassium uptake protein [Thiohalobacter thiocyanaticus]|uniref:TrkH family potassium uptake protein n=1 Tax=Thiohalobacter thiocyanaticus TaxID=585455 RepID=A0A426QML4_9GAMM|nr:TrkH family potassium uptake protein [Thiohalobacter thiocyanaticus]
MLALLTLPPLGCALLEHNWAMAWRFGLLCSGLSLAGGMLAGLPAPDRIQVNEALTVTALAFVGAALLMSWPMSEAGVVFIDALFEAVSGVTTTGLSTLGNIEARSTTFLFTRAWMQWYGGLGFIVLSVALLMGHQAASRRLVGSVESSAAIMVTARTHAMRTLIVYTCLTAAGLALIWPLAQDGFTALLHVLSAVSTGGFSNHTASLAGMSSQSTAVAVMALSFLGAVSLHLYWRVGHAGWRHGAGTLFTDIELRSLLLLCLISGSVLGLLAWQNDVSAPWYQGFIIGISAQTTTGFTTMPVSDLDPVSKLVMILSMLVGGSVGSSAGGFKILRLLILVRLLQLMLRRTAMPVHAVAEPYLGDQKLETDDAIRALQLILLFIIIIIVSWIPFLMLGYDPLDALFEVVSASGTVGLSSGIARPELEPVLKGILCFDMLAGRVEIVALLVVLYSRTWFGRREKVA